MPQPSSPADSSARSSWLNHYLGFRLGFTQLTEPVRAWSAMKDHGLLWTALTIQILFYLFGGIVSAGPLSDLVKLSGLTPQKLVLSQVAIVVLRIALFVVLANIGWAVMIRASLLLGNIRIELRKALTWVAYSTIPFALGYFLGAIQFWFFEPLTDEPMAILGWIIRPFSFGLASILPGYFQPLSLQWFFASFLDIFGIWSGGLLIVGSRKYLGLKPVTAAWCTGILLLLFILAVVLMWQIVQTIVLGAR